MPVVKPKVTGAIREERNAPHRENAQVTPHHVLEGSHHLTLTPRYLNFAVLGLDLRYGVINSESCNTNIHLPRKLILHRT